jgi:hypothetical protein
LAFTGTTVLPTIISITVITTIAITIIKHRGSCG